MPSTETEARMVMAHKQGRKKAHQGFQREYIVNLAKILPTIDEHDAFIAGFDGEKRRMANAENQLKTLQRIKNMFTPICVQCQREMRCKKNDYLFREGDEIWAGDMYECSQCETQIVTGFAREPVGSKWRDDGMFDAYAPRSNFTLDR